MEERLDLIREGLFVLAILTPIIALFLFWRAKELSRINRIYLGLSIGLLIGVIIMWISMELLFRNGLGA